MVWQAPCHCQLQAGALRLDGEEAGAGGRDQPLQLPGARARLRGFALLSGQSTHNVSFRCAAVTEGLRVATH